MASPSSRQSSNKSKHSAFVPSPRFLSVSPAKNRTPSHIDNPGQPSYAPPNANDLRSPIPPPPANLYPGSPSAFNVDPGAPFLAAAAPTDDHRSDNGSVRDDPGPKGFTGAVVLGIKNVVKRSLRDRSRSQYHQNQRKNQQEDENIYDLPPQHRDSGYAISSVPIPPSGLPPMPQNLSTPASSRHTAYSAHAPSETLLGHVEERYDRDDATIIGHSNSIGQQKTKPINKEYEYGARYAHESPPTPAQQYQQQVINSRQSQPASPSQPVLRRHAVPQPTYSEIIGPEDIASPVSADLQIGPNYKQMDVRTPLPSEISLNTYLKRLQKFARDVNSLPWIAKERVTKDYYPERTRRSDEPKKAPAIVWRSEAFVKAEGYHAQEGSADDESFSEWSGTEGSFKDGNVKMGLGMHAPRRGSRSAMDLDVEFEGSRTPMPANPPNMTPYVRPRGVQLTDTPMPRQSQPPDSVLFQRGPPPDMILPPPLPVPPVDNRGDEYVRSIPSRPPPIPVAQTPNAYVPSGPLGGSEVGQNIPRDQLVYSRDYAQPPPPPPPGVAGQDLNNWYPPPATPQFYSIEAVKQVVPTAEFPYLGPNPDWGGQPPIVLPAPTGPRKHDHATSPSPVIPTSHIPPSAPTYHATPRVSVYPKPSTPQSVWEQYPSNDRTGYVPSQYAEHFYGNQYGPGVHAARPPLVPPPITASAASRRSSRSRRSSVAP